MAEQYLRPVKNVYNGQQYSLDPSSRTTAPAAYNWKWLSSYVPEAADTINESTLNSDPTGYIYSEDHYDWLVSYPGSFVAMELTLSTLSISPDFISIVAYINNAYDDTMPLFISLYPSGSWSSPITYSGDVTARYGGYKSGDFTLTDEQKLNLVRSSGNLLVNISTQGGFSVGASSFDVSQLYVYVSGTSVLGETLGNTLYISGPNAATPKVSTLFTTGPHPYYNFTSLYTYSEQPTSGIPLSIAAHETIETGFPLYTSGAYYLNNSMELFISANLDEAIDLFIKAQEPTYAYGISPLVIWTDGAGGSGYYNNNTNLYLENFESYNNGTTLFTEAPASSILTNTAPLYITTVLPTDKYNSTTIYLENIFESGNANTTLFTTSFTDSSGITTLHTIGSGWEPMNFASPLYMQNIGIYDISNSSGVNLYIDGHGNINNIPLYIGGYYNDMSGLVPLTITGGTGEFFTANDMNLFMSGNYEPRTSFPLYISSANSAENTDTIPLFVMNDTTKNSNMDLFMYNSVEAAISGQKLFISGDGLFVGSSVSRGYAPLYISRGNDSYDTSVAFTIPGPSGGSDGIDLMIQGTNISYSGVNLVMPNTVGPENNNMSTYIHGF